MVSGLWFGKTMEVKRRKYLNYKDNLDIKSIIMIFLLYYLFFSLTLLMLDSICKLLLNI